MEHRSIAGELHLRSSYYSAAAFVRGFVAYAQHEGWDVSFLAVQLPRPNADTPLEAAQFLDAAIDRKAVAALMTLGLARETAQQVVAKAPREAELYPVRLPSGRLVVA